MTSEAPTHPRVHIKSWKCVASWKWDVAEENGCSICNTEFEMAAPGIKFPGDDSPIVLGRCGHAFHLQCIEKWIYRPGSTGTCPICRRPFEFKN
ncbi:hypothetical protein TVAG_389590 [Trichomonas vaginalis G3]|uniref:Anaphase-promoting complex subunit 11 n=1 Tax=Trichomonas vaginalis (strain ATCC PRA-98 / G3) TaxID=412133 RepID=A2E161_TRIV3|nr:Cullin family protein binding [Trichomonas vaginalis G3]EAY13562.1 hypothetical protein TVAG_389590 [Trichomonas vaginalis G3]KAI5486390.1 Cullin family protein binding [Trichomonas vaginalis G3]|eukprot:XP_001325785.1 hypothetical protein [Trichomonas vaginalis G3]